MQRWNRWRHPRSNARDANAKRARSRPSRRYQDDKVDIIHKYNADEARNLKQYGELPETARINETAVDMAMEGDDANDDIGIDFDEI